MFSWLSRRPLALQMQLKVAAILVLSMAAFFAALVPRTKHMLETSHETGHVEELALAVSLITGMDAQLREKATVGVNTLQRMNASGDGAFAVDSVAALGDGMAATIFVRKGDAFVRLYTSVKKEDGSRAVGSELDKAGGAFAALKNGDSYTKPATLFGKTYMTSYIPTKGLDGAINGAYFVGVDASKTLATVNASFARMKVGKTGYFYVYSTAEANHGLLLMHPNLQGKSLYESKDADGYAFMQAMLAKGSGVIHYNWQNPGEDKARQKFVAFDKFDPWAIGIAASGYTDDLTEDVWGIVIGLAGLQLAAMLLLMGALWLAVRTSVSKPLALLNVDLARVAKGFLPDLQPLPASGNELHQMTTELALAIAGIRDLVSTATLSADEVKTGATELSAANLEMASRTESQASTVEETSAAMNGIAKAVEQNSQQAKQALSLAVSASGSAAKGGEAMTEAISAMADIEQQSIAVQSIVARIDQIAMQTSLLSLNAAIEAARAGAAGRGFAVVAQEVRRLAADSKVAVAEIGQLVNKSAAATKQGTVLIRAAGNTIAEAVVSIGRVHEALTEVQASALAQSTSVQQVCVAVDQIDSMTQKNAAMVEQVSAAAINLRERANCLSDSVGEFKVE